MKKRYRDRGHASGAANDRRAVLYAIAAGALAGAVVAASRATASTDSYRGFTVDTTAIERDPAADTIMAAVNHQLDIVADCGARPDVLAFFRSQLITLHPGLGEGGGRFTHSNGVEVDSTPPDPPAKPVILHELLHAFHARAMPGGFDNPDIITFYRRALAEHAYRAPYVLSNAKEFFAVTASLYLSGYVDRPPYTRRNLRLKQPAYYTWLGQLFGVTY